MSRLLRLLTAVTVLALAAGTLSAQTPFKPQDPTKWSQPVDVELGYDAPSFWRVGTPRPFIVVADDWRCPDGLPVTDVHWWGSFLEGDSEGLLGFEISIHSDIVPDGIHPSHPGALLYSTTFTMQEVLTQFYAETANEPIYQYNVDLREPFAQTQGTIYWLDIIALVDNETVWGWHTGVRPQPDPTLDDAVTIYDYNPQTGTYVTYTEMFDTQGSVAMAFELTTVPEPATMSLLGAGAALMFLRRRSFRKFAAMLLAAVALTLVAGGSLFAQAAPEPALKWSQAPDMVTGRDIESYWQPGADYPTVVVADDWRCLDGLPVTDIHWWGSYPTIPSGPIGVSSVAGVLSFELSIHADIPAVGNTPSHPGQLLWSKDYIVGSQVFESFFGTDSTGESVFQYDLVLPEADWFHQEQGRIYWLDVIARTSTPEQAWGWHTGVRPANVEDGLDAAVMIFDYDPSSGNYSQWGPLYDFCHVQMAFELTTVPEPGTLALFGSAALGGLGLLRRRRTMR